MAKCGVGVVRVSRVEAWVRGGGLDQWLPWAGQFTLDCTTAHQEGLPGNCTSDYPTGCGTGILNSNLPFHVIR